jgi:L-asparagine transporter-like permease
MKSIYKILIVAVAITLTLVTIYDYTFTLSLICVGAIIGLITLTIAEIRYAYKQLKPKKNKKKVLKNT